jgi:serine/threonine protein kinase
MVMTSPLQLSDLVPGARLGHYMISDRIAQGGMGTVFKATEPALERFVAIKVLRPEYASNPSYVQYFQEEARAVAAIRHPNIVPIFYIGQEGDVVFFSMAYIEGQTFDDYIDRKQWFDEAHARWFLSHAIAALHSAHKANIVHLDIKPANFLIDQANNIMLTDFGLAEKIVKGVGEKTQREAFGTPAYVSPEQITRSPTDQRTDIYSLGATLFHLMTGQPPFNGATVEDIVWAHLEKPFPIEVAHEAHVPTGWIHLLKRMMARSPDDRFADYRELRTALENVQTFRYETGPLEAPPPPKPLNKPRTGQNSQTLHGLLSAGKAKWEVLDAKDSTSIRIARDLVIDSMTSRLEPLKVARLLPTIRDLCKPQEEDPDALVETLERVPGYDPALRALADFMMNPQEGEERAAAMRPLDVLEVVGLERSRNLALTFFALNFELAAYANFDWKPLWRHQLAAGVCLDFFYDALSLRRTGLEYVTGAFHDIGKLILAELYPFAYFTTMNRSMQDEVSLVECERQIFSIDHAEIGALWMKQNGLPPALVDAVAQHERPERIHRRALLAHALVSTNHLVKQLGIGYSGNSLLDPRPWEELPATGAIFEARGNRDYDFDSFAHAILDQFQSFPDLV